MSELYNLIESLCKEKGTNITAMCKAAKISRAPLTELKMGRSKLYLLPRSPKLPPTSVSPSTIF